MNLRIRIIKPDKLNAQDNEVIEYINKNNEPPDTDP